MIFTKYFRVGKTFIKMQCDLTGFGVALMANPGQRQLIVVVGPFGVFFNL